MYYTSARLFYFLYVFFFKLTFNQILTAPMRSSEHKDAFDMIIFCCLHSVWHGYCRSDVVLKINTHEFVRKTFRAIPMSINSLILCKFAERMSRFFSCHFPLIYLFSCHFHSEWFNSENSLVRKLRYWHRNNVTTCNWFCC